MLRQQVPANNSPHASTFLHPHTCGCMARISTHTVCWRTLLRSAVASGVATLGVVCECASVCVCGGGGKSLETCQKGGRQVAALRTCLLGRLSGFV